MAPPTVARAISAVAGIASRVAPRLAGRLLARLFTMPISHRVPPREQQWMRGAEVSWLVFDDQRSMPVYTFGGDGPIVLLVHGWSGRGSQLGAYVEPLLRAGYRVVTYDAPAHGRAQGRRSSLPELALALERVVEFTGPVAAVIAHSLGAAATTMAVARGLVAERLVYIAPPAAPGRYLARLAAFLGFSSEVAARAQQLLERRFGVPFNNVSARALVPALRQPLLVIHDHGDPEVPHAEGAYIAGAWLGARLLTTQGLGHHRIVRDDTVVQSAVRFVVCSSTASEPANDSAAVAPALASVVVPASSASLT